MHHKSDLKMNCPEKKIIAKIVRIIEELKKLSFFVAKK